MQCKVRMLKPLYLCESSGCETAARVRVTFCRQDETKSGAWRRSVAGGDVWGGRYYMAAMVNNISVGTGALAQSEECKMVCWNAAMMCVSVEK